MVDGASDKLKPSMTRAILDLLREKCSLHKVNTTGCRTEEEYRQALNEQAPQWEQEDAPPPRRRAKTEASDKKRTSGEVEPPLEKSSAKKPKPLEPLVVAEPGVKEPSEALIKACKAVLADHGKPPRKEGDLITSSAVWAAAKRDYSLTGRLEYSRDRALADATRALAKRYEDLKPDEKKTSPLRWLDASAQKNCGNRTDVAAAKKEEVKAMATEVERAVAAARTAAIKISRYGKAFDLAKGVLGLFAEFTLLGVLRATTVGDILRERSAPPWLTQEQVAVFWKVLSKLPASMPLYEIKEGALIPTGLPRVDFWIALAEPIAALVALEPEFASLRPLVGYMLPVHVKKNAPDFGPGGGAHAKATLTSAVEALARRFNNRRSSIERDEGELRRSPTDAHTYAPRGVATDKLPGPTEGIILNVSLEMQNGELAVAGLFVGDTYRERYDFGDDNAATVTTFKPEAAKAGQGEIRDCKRFERENAFGHSLAAALLAPTLNIADLALVTSWVLRDAFVNPPPPFVLELYQDEKAVEWGQHAGLGPALELATGCWLVGPDLRLEFSRTGGAYDSELVASRGAVLRRLREYGARLEWKAVTDHGAPRVKHGAGGLVATARWCDVVVWTDLGSGPLIISAADAPFCVDNIERTLREVHALHKALGASRDHDEAYGKFLKKSAVLRKVRLAFCFIGDLDKKGVPLEAQTRRVSFAADWAVVKRDICDAIDYCLERRDAWRAVPPDARERTKLGPRVPTGDPFKLVTPTVAGVAADITQPAPPAPPLVVQPHGTAGGLAVAPKPPQLRTPKARPAPWKESATRFCAAAPPKKKARRK